LAEPDPHLFDLHQLYSLKQKGTGQVLLADSKIQSGHTSLYHIFKNDLHGDHATRQQIQLEYQKKGEEWIDPVLADRISDLTWPIAFLDFETTMAAIPWYPGMQPFQVLPFQFSCHILYRDGRMVHREWLNTEDRIPTLPFIRQLRKVLEDVGSVLVYTDYENRILKEGMEFLGQFGANTKDDRAWILDLLHSGRIVDQHDWVYRHYFHPARAGRTSIKVVLPAIWKSNPALHLHRYFSRYFREKDGQIIDPYKTLPSVTLSGIPFAVREGCAVMQAYRELILGKGSTCEETNRMLQELLRSYVTLDTASQWIIFEHWLYRLDIHIPA
jgi:hypothetical protein